MIDGFEQGKHMHNHRSDPTLEDRERALLDIMNKASTDEPRAIINEVELEENNLNAIEACFENKTIKSLILLKNDLLIFYFYFMNIYI